MGDTGIVAVAENSCIGNVEGEQSLGPEYGVLAPCFFAVPIKPMDEDDAVR
jgi:hypothetical protein